MKIVKTDPERHESAVGDLYYGADIDYQYLARPPECERLDICHVSFEPGGRNKFHTHIYEQMLFVTAGRGKVATKDGEHLVVPGDLIVIPAGEPHWHGATESDSFAHICIERHNNEIEIVE